eukprot:g9254.t1
MVNTVQKTVEVPQIEYIDNHVHIPVQKQRHVPVHVPVEKPVEVQVIETLEKIVDVPVVKQIEVPQVQTIEKIVEIPLEHSLAQKLCTSFSKREHPAQVVQQVIMGEDHPVQAG